MRELLASSSMFSVAYPGVDLARRCGRYSTEREPCRRSLVGCSATVMNAAVFDHTCFFFTPQRTGRTTRWLVVCQWSNENFGSFWAGLGQCYGHYLLWALLLVGRTRRAEAVMFWWAAAHPGVKKTKKHPQIRCGRAQRTNPILAAFSDFSRVILILAPTYWFMFRQPVRFEPQPPPAASISSPN